MKKILYFLVFTVFVTSSADAQRKRNVQQQAETKAPPAFVPTAEGPKIEFINVVHDYGQIEQGANGESEFRFRNVGSEPLVLTNVRTFCGCTKSTWPREPIMPGEEAIINIGYNTSIIGSINRAVTVESNSVENSSVSLRITGNVIPKQN